VEKGILDPRSKKSFFLYTEFGGPMAPDLMAATAAAQP
jgi:hypothetical protein